MKHKNRKAPDVRTYQTRWLMALDNWHPNYPLDLVSASCHYLNGIAWRVCVSGADDTCMEQDFTDHDSAVRCFESLPQIVTMGDLLARGFKFA